MSDLLVEDEIFLKDLKAVIFDKDGTLIDIHHYWSSIIKIRAKLVATKWFQDNQVEDVKNNLIDLMGFDLITNKMKPQGPIGVKPRSFIVKIVTDYVRQSGFEINNAEVEYLFKKVDEETSKNMLPLLKVLPGVKKLLIKLNEFGIRCFIATTDITSRAKMAMKTLGLEMYFDKVIGSDLVNNSKPYPDLINFALKGVDFGANQVAIIGDHPVDVMMGVNSNSGLNVAVLTGISDSSVFDELNCIIVQDLNSIKIKK